jgi:Mrp family chromosome partitioning ATPase
MNAEALHMPQEANPLGRERDARAVFERPVVNSVRSRSLRLPQEEALRLVHEIFLVNTVAPPAVVVFAGIEDGRGCAEISASVAEILATDEARQVCLVDTNFRSPKVPDPFLAGNGQGFAEALTIDGPIKSFARKAPNRDSLWVLTSGGFKASSPNLLASGRLGERLRELRAEFDFVLIDAPPLTKYADAVALGQVADGVVLVLEAGSTRRDDAAHAVTSLRNSKVPILAAVLNNLDSPVPRGLLNHF